MGKDAITKKEETLKPVHGKKWMPAMYVAYFGILEKIANDHGYALCIHGTVMRDFDIIAVPFMPIVSPQEEVIAAIREVVGLDKSADPKFHVIGHDPHGRTCYTIECGGGGYFDISFTPTVEQIIEKLKADKQRRKEMSSLLKKSR